MPVPTTTDAIFLVLGALSVVGLSLLICSERLYPSPKKIGRRKKLLISTMILIGVCVAGTINLALVRRSGRSFATGTLVGLRQHIGKHNHSRFSVQREDGSLMAVTCDYDYDHLVEGEAVSVEVLDYQSTLLHLSVLDGEYRGWNLNEGDGTSGSEIAIAYALLAATVFYLKLRQSPMETRDKLRAPHDRK